MLAARTVAWLSRRNKEARRYDEDDAQFDDDDSLLSSSNCAIVHSSNRLVDQEIDCCNQRESSEHLEGCCLYLSDYIRFLKLHKEITSSSKRRRSISSLTRKCHHHRTKTKCFLPARDEVHQHKIPTATAISSSAPSDDFLSSPTRLNTNYNCTNDYNNSKTTLFHNYNYYSSMLTKRRRQKTKSHHHSSYTSWLPILIFTSIIYYIVFATTKSLTKHILVAQASSAASNSPATGTNYWPLVHQHRYQQLFFTGRTRQEFDTLENSNRNINKINNQDQHQQHEDQHEEHQQHNQQQAERRSFLHGADPLARLHAYNHHAQQQSAALAAAAAALAATANAALARKSQSHNLMIGQNFNNFSSIIPYSIAHDVDYGSSMMQEDQIINEPMSDMHGSNYQDDQQQHNQLETNSNNNNIKSPSEPSDTKSELNLSQQQQQHSDSSSVLAGPAASQESQQQQQEHSHYHPTEQRHTTNKVAVSASDRAALSLSSLTTSDTTNRLMLPQMQQIKARFNQGCVGGTKCQFFAFCWMSGGSLGASCGLLMTCCVTPSRQEIQPGFYGPVVNDPYCGRSTSKISRIVGGTDASFGQFPWQAFVQVGGSRCGGALISSRHVVTAGHCVARSQHSPSSIKITLGDYILNSDIESIPHEVYSVVEVLLHPNFRFTPQADRYDVAVLELDRAASYKDNIKPICLPQKDATFVGRVAYVAGWGALQAGSKLRPKVLQHVAVPVIENNVCESWHRRKGIDIRIYDEMMCAGYEMGQRDACQGDSGGPLMLNQFGVWYLVGIVSAGYSCAKQYQPGIYHRVSSSSDWISSNVYQQQQGGNSK